MLIKYTQVAALALLASTAPFAYGHSVPKLIIDTDIFIGCDDAAALALANLFHARGQIELLGVMVNTPSRFGAPAVSAINTYYNHTRIPVGALKPVDNSTAAPDYARLLATAFPGYVKDGADAPDAVPLYRQLLAGQEDGAVTVVSIGYLENLSGLLRSTGDVFSHMGGFELVERKVKEMVVMGGQYPSGREYNFYNDNPSLTDFVIDQWPTPMVFTGNEIGSNILAGAVLTDHAPATDPVRAAYIATTGAGLNNYTWDPTAVMYAAFGLDDFFVYGNDVGSISVSSNGSDVWEKHPTKDQHYLAFPKKKDANVTVANAIDRWLVAKP